MERPTRRAMLAGAAGAALAGCLGPESGGAGTEEPSPASPESATEPATTAETTPSPTAMGTGVGADLDLWEANVVGVAVSAEDENRYRFDVTLHHDDDGEAGYANWWQVERRDGEKLGRRELLHAHGSRPFTRSATVAVPAGTDCVIVRGHDQTHGYGGRAVLVRPATGAQRAVFQGREPMAMTDEQCPGE